MVNFIIAALCFSLGFIYGWLSAMLTNKVFDKANLRAIIIVFILLMASMLYLKILNSGIILGFIGIVVGYCYCCKPAQWHYFASKYFKHY
ncbi:hypothetical protein KJ812_01950 [Patescibacteria group bacterium]|nr:hypothetical protein [Patescibacteria group bacterium]MBU4125047.1 hypothetical protein [Patescibacteria group bacterium]